GVAGAEQVPFWHTKVLEHCELAVHGEPEPPRQHGPVPPHTPEFELHSPLGQSDAVWHPPPPEGVVPVPVKLMVLLARRPKPAGALATSWKLPVVMPDRNCPERPPLLSVNPQAV